MLKIFLDQAVSSYFLLSLFLLMPFYRFLIFVEDFTAFVLFPFTTLQKNELAAGANVTREEGCLLPNVYKSQFFPSISRIFKLGYFEKKQDLFSKYV